jgi:hypothetical protein
MITIEAELIMMQYFLTVELFSVKIPFGILAFFQYPIQFFAIY